MPNSYCQARQKDSRQGEAAAEFVCIEHNCSSFYKDSCGDFSSPLVLKVYDTGSRGTPASL
jgi:hypothetical protein